MRWFRIRKTDIPATHREAFEQYGVQVVALLLAGISNSPIYRGPPELQEIHFSAFREQRLRNLRVEGKSIEDAPGLAAHRFMHKSAAKWLIENHDREERKQTWSLTMEFTIVCLILAELWAMFHKG